MKRERKRKRKEKVTKENEIFNIFPTQINFRTPQSFHTEVLPTTISQMVAPPTQEETPTQLLTD